MDVNESSCFLHKSSCEKKKTDSLVVLLNNLFDEVERDITSYWLENSVGS